MILLLDRFCRLMIIFMMVGYSSVEWVLLIDILLMGVHDSSAGLVLLIDYSFDDGW